MNIEIPCNVGDYVYELNKAQEKIETHIVVHVEVHIGRDKNQVVLITFATYGFCRLADFGETVFTDRADALHALDEYLSRKKKK